MMNVVRYRCSHTAVASDRLLRADQVFDQVCAAFEVADRLSACGCAASLCSDYVQNKCLCCYSRYNASRCRLTSLTTLLRFLVTAQPVSHLSL